MSEWGVACRSGALHVGVGRCMGGQAVSYAATACSRPCSCTATSPAAGSRRRWGHGGPPRPGAASPVHFPEYTYTLSPTPIPSVPHALRAIPVGLARFRVEQGVAQRAGAPRPLQRPHAVQLWQAAPRAALADPFDKTLLPLRAVAGVNHVRDVRVAVAHLHLEFGKGRVVWTLQRQVLPAEQLSLLRFPGPPTPHMPHQMVPGCTCVAGLPPTPPTKHAACSLPCIPPGLQRISPPPPGAPTQHLDDRGQRPHAASNVSFSEQQLRQTRADCSPVPQRPAFLLLAAVLIPSQDFLLLLLGSLRSACGAGTIAWGALPHRQGKNAAMREWSPLNPPHTAALAPPPPSSPPPSLPPSPPPPPPLPPSEHRGAEHKPLTEARACSASNALLSCAW